MGTTQNSPDSAGPANEGAEHQSAAQKASLLGVNGHAFTLNESEAVPKRRPLALALVEDSS